MTGLRTWRMSLSLVAILVTAGPGCSRHKDGGLKDENLLTREEALTRFQGAFDSVHALAGGASSRDALVADFVRALETRDTAALVRMSITGGEFAYLYYPGNPQSLPPYDLRPALMWQMVRVGSESGLARLLAERSGFPLEVTGYSCDDTVSVQGANRLTGPCMVRRRFADGGTAEERLFGLVLERQGEFKFVSYANSLD